MSVVATDVARIRLVIVILAAAMLVVPAATASASTLERERFGTSVQGRALTVNVRGPEDARRTILIVGCIHGNECAGRAIIRRLYRQRIPADTRVWFIGTANPDGYRRGTRHNARGVDLNRNFPHGWRRETSRGHVFFQGPRRASEPETRALMELIRRIRPDATVWYHQHMNLVDVNGAHRWRTRRYARAVGLRSQSIGTTLHGTATSWQNHLHRGTTAFVVELPAGRVSAAAARIHARAAVHVMDPR